MANAALSSKRMWAKALALSAMSTLGMVVIVTAFSHRERPASATVTSSGRLPIVRTAPQAERSGAAVTGRLDEDARGERTVVDILPRSPYGDVYLAQLRKLLGLRDAAPISSDRMLQLARALKHARVARDGRFRCDDLAPGDYVVIAFTDDRTSTAHGIEGLTVRTASVHVAPHSQGRTIVIARLTLLE